MRITLNRLVLLNFKGIRKLTVDFSDHTQLRGRNETGKTSLFDAWYWLLFDKDSLGKKEFGIKTTDENHNVIHGLEHSVEGSLNVDGKIVVLKKVYSENWVKKRGSAESEFTGHTTKYFIDEVPAKQKEYKDFVASLMDETKLRLLTDPMYFNVQMNWQDRRSLLLEICGDVSDDEVIASDKALAKLPSILGDRSIEDQRKVIAGKRKTINEELQTLPVRIDEAERSKPDFPALGESELKAHIEQLKFEVDSKEAEIARLQSGGQVTELQNRMREIDGELLEIKNQAQSGTYESITKQRRTISEIQAQVDHLTSSIDRIDKTVNRQHVDAEEALQQADKKRAEWVELNAETFQGSVDDTCSTCGQSLPEDKVEEAREKALRAFNQHKSERLEKIQQDGVAAKQRATELVESNESLSAERQTLQTRLESEIEALEAANSELTRLQGLVQDVSENADYIAKKREKDELATKISSIRQSISGEVETLRTALMDTRDELRRKESLLARFDQVRKLDQRIEELRQQERKLASQFEELEEQLYLTEEFIKTKVQMLESRINSKFEYTRFKLFKEQINGGLEECCTALYKGVAYDAGLNTGGRILVGLDIIRTLQQHFGISAVVWVDNDESLTSDVEMDCQLIELIANRDVKTLQVEHLDEVKESV